MGLPVPRKHSEVSQLANMATWQPLWSCSLGEVIMQHLRLILKGGTGAFSQLHYLPQIKPSFNYQ